MYRITIHLYGAEVKKLELASGCEYTAGRGSNCDIVLEDQPGISRTHFRIFEENGQWTVQVLSKFGTVVHAGQPVNHLSLDLGAVFKLAGYDFRFEEAHAEETEEEVPGHIEQALPMAVGMAESVSAQPNPFVPATLEPPVPFEGNDDATRVGVALNGVPYLRIVDSEGGEESVTLEGKKWVAGRDESCEIVLNDRKASRRHFELSSTHQGYFVRDLQSANGTFVNGLPLAPDELRPLRSGDVLTASTLTLHFEIRDPSFDKKLAVIPTEMLASPPMIPRQQVPTYEMINYPVPSGPGGAVRIDNYAPSPWDANSGWKPEVDPAEAKKKKLRLYLVIAAIIIGAAAAFSSLRETKRPDAVVKNDAFSRLTPAQQKQVQETYVLAHNLFIQNKYAMAAAQLQKIHDILPDGYEKSRAMAEQCRDFAAQEEQQRFLEQERKKQEENRRVVEQNLRDCAQLASTSYSLDEIKHCLGRAIELDPMNPAIQEVIGQVQARVSERERQLAAQKNHQELVARGVGLYQKAEKLDRDGDVFGALDAYKKHMNSTFPDPGSLKEKSRRRTLAIKKEIEAKIDAALASAQAAYANQSYREALDHIKRAKELYPNDEKVAELNAKIRRDLTLRMKELYSESIIDEGLGNVPKAIKEWQEIMKTDHPDGEYYKKAKSKLHSVGAL